MVRTQPEIGNPWKDGLGPINPDEIRPQIHAQPRTRKTS
jgi:hypothetical protein